MIKNKIKTLIMQILSINEKFAITEPPAEENYDFSTNLLFRLAKLEKKHPEFIFNKIKNKILSLPQITEFIYVPPGYANFKISDETIYEEIKKIISEGTKYPKEKIVDHDKVLFEYISANPTGPLHIGHARSAVLGDALSNIYIKLGYDVEREYYINDVGYQVYLLGISVMYRLKEKLGITICDEEKNLFDKSGYKGDYISLLADDVRKKFKIKSAEDIENLKLSDMIDFSVSKILKLIRLDLKSLGIKFDNWFSEKSLYEPQNKVQEVLDKLQKYIYEHEGAKFFAASKFTDEKDRVVIRSEKKGILIEDSYHGYTYFASDIAYHYLKYNREYKEMINIWGADHYGYINRIKSAITALGLDASRLKILLYQFVTLIKEGKQIAMSTREGIYMSLRDILNELGNDCLRYFLLAYAPDSHIFLDFDIAKKKSIDNPIFYIQYAHTRCCGVFRRLEEKSIEFVPKDIDFSLLIENIEKKLMKQLITYGDTLISSAENLTVHFLTNYLFELAKSFHNYYDHYRIIVDDIKLMNARLSLVYATKIILKNGLTLLGISAPERM